MKLSRTFKLAFRSIWSAKARSLLTMLGIIIGVAAVIVIVGLGNGMENYMTESFQSMGTNLLSVSVFGRGSARSVDIDDMYEILDNNRDLFTGMSPSISVRPTVKHGTETLDLTSVSGVSEDFLVMKSYSLTEGRFVVYADNLSRSKVCVIGSYVSNTLFAGGGVGETIKLNGDFYEVVGILNEISDSTESSSDNVVYLPYASAMKLPGNYTGIISTYSFAMTDEEHIAESKAAIEDVLFEVFGSTNSYSVTSMSEMLDTMTGMIGMVVMILAIIAGISLLVGGIGIMNIMLVSVSERTREIGIRKALGAKRRNILLQFVVEAGTTSAIGGALGIAIGYLLSSAASVLIGVMSDVAISVTPSSWSVMMAFGVSAGIGVLFGYLPARKAAKLNPIDALRYE